MKNLIFFLLFPVFLFAQYGNNVVTNPDFPASTDGWSGVGATISWEAAFNGRSCLKATDTNNSFTIAQNPNSTTVNGVTYRWMFDYYIPSSNTSLVSVRIRTQSENQYIGGLQVVTDSWTTVNLGHVAKSVQSTNYSIWGWTPIVIGDVYYIDNVITRQVLDTLYTDPSLADETDTDSTKTLTEAFVTRGSHSGGTFITTVGTYAETFAIDSSFTLWRSSTAGGAVTVTAVDFNSVTATLLDIYVATPTNDDNITYTYTPAATTDTPKRKFGSYGGWGGWLK